MTKDNLQPWLYLGVVVSTVAIFLLYVAMAILWERDRTRRHDEQEDE